MDDYFKNTSQFCLLGSDPPQCFLDLEDHLAPRAAGLFHPGMDPVIALAENVCRRLGDVLLSAGEITLKRKRASLGGHIMISSRLIGFYASCKALLDAVAITLTHQYQLAQDSGAPLTSKQQDFAKQQLWNALRAQQQPVFDRYNQLRPTMNEIIEWRDVSLHRVSPYVVTSLGRNPDTRVAKFLEYETVIDPEPDFTRLLGDANAYRHGPATFHYDRWRENLLRISEEVCADITATT